MLSRFPRFRLFLTLLLTFWAVMLVFRLGFYAFYLTGSTAPTSDLLQAFSMGASFDLRMALLMVLPIGIISLLPWFLGLRGFLGKAVALVATTLAAGLMMFVYIVDFEFYGYTGKRLNASILRFLNDSGGTNAGMVWETYPVILLTLLIVVVCVLTWWFTSRVIKRYRSNNSPNVWWHFLFMVPLVLAIVFYSVVGKFGSVVPLRWSDAFFNSSPKVVALSLNPAVFFMSTHNNANCIYDEASGLMSYLMPPDNKQSCSFNLEKLKKTYPAVAAYFGVDHPNVKTFNMARKVAGHPVDGRRPNIVFIHLESLGANRSGLYGNPLHSTPNVDAAAKQGIFFPNFMVPASGTARTIFGLVTSIPDVTWGGSTASRNALISGQYTLVNAFKGYKKLYFIGGDAGWANVQGLLQHSIHNLELWQDGDYSAPAVDTWGISDHSLFVAANKRLNELPDDKPFVAFIQLAGNHRPFTIPDEDIGFKLKQVDEDKLKKWGYLGLDQYNAIRLMDYNVGLYLNKMVPASDYANNTIFFMYGDHNDRSTTPSKMDGYSEEMHHHQLLKHHVPFIIYSPGLIKKPQVREQVATLMDLMPTALGMAGLPYVNRTMGRDLLHWKGQGYAFTFGGARGTRPLLGLLTQTDFLSMLYDGRAVAYYKLTDPKHAVTDEYPKIVAKRKTMLTGFYQMATYLLTHNVASSYQ